jgi:hypothetical protein
MRKVGTRSFVMPCPLRRFASSTRFASLRGTKQIEDSTELIQIDSKRIEFEMKKRRRTE